MNPVNQLLHIANSLVQEKVRGRMAAWNYGLNPSEFKEGDTVGVSASFYGGSALNIVLTGNVKNVDEKSRKVFLHVHQSGRSANHPTQFHPEDLILLHRPKSDDGEPVDVPIYRHQSFLDYSGEDSLE